MIQMLSRTVFAIAVIALMSNYSSFAATKTEIPAAVLQAFAKAYPTVNISGYDKEAEGGKLHYEIQSKVDGREENYVYLEDGTLLQIETDIPREALPKAVVQALIAIDKDARIIEAERITRGLTIEYEVVIISVKQKRELLLAADGKLLPSDTEDDDTDSTEADD